MADRRRYSGTQRLQAGWAILVVVGFALTMVVGPPIETVFVVVGFGLALLLGLVGLGLRERQRWNAMVEQSSFAHERGTRSADLERLYRDRSVFATTMVPSLLSQTHLEITARVSDVDAEFKITLEYVGSGGTDDGLLTGTDAIDETFVIRGTKQNVAQVLSTDVQAALLDIETPGTCTITGNRVQYTVPFTNLSAAELDTIADALVVIADRVETVAKGPRSP